MCGADYARREAGLAAWLAQNTQIQRAAIILEGLPSGHGELSDTSQVSHLQRLASGCLCCAGKLVFQVSIQRSLKQAPDLLVIAIDQAEHLAQLHDLLTNSQYAAHLSNIIQCDLTQIPDNFPRI